MKIVYLDSGIINPGDISWEKIESIGEFINYKKTPEPQIIERIGDADAILVDSACITKDIMKKCPALKFIGVSATGFDNVDIAAAGELGIAVANVPEYSTEAVAQHTFALLLSVTNKIAEYNDIVTNKCWGEIQGSKSLTLPVNLLAGKSMGIIGYGNIGRKVGEIARAFGMTVNVYSKDREATVKSDVISLHCPLTEENAKMIDREFIEQMKPGAVFVNTARGGLVDEKALAEALRTGRIAGAGLDVLSEEPPDESNPLLDLQNCIITPHIAFSPVEARTTVIETCAENLKSFIKGENLNRLV